MGSKSGKYHKKHDIIIVGGGFAGLTMALGLGNSGFNVACIDKQTPTEQIKTDNDVRTVVISYGTSKILEKVNIWHKLEKAGCLIKKVEILDGKKPYMLNFDTKEVAGETFGWVINNVFLLSVLLEAIKKHKNIIHLAPAEISNIKTENDNVQVELKDSSIHGAKLLIGADGRQSFVRKFQKIKSFGWSYRQTAIACVVQHDKPHNNLAIEQFSESGAFASIPMMNDRQNNYQSSIIWTQDTIDNKCVLSSSEKDFNNMLNQQMNGRFGDVQLVGKRQCYPLSFQHAYNYTAKRTVLIADAAHSIHPIAAQGLNLGMRDVDELLDILVQAKIDNKDIGGDTILRQYERKRLADNTLMCIGTDVMNTLFKIEFMPFKRMRQLGVKTVGHIPPLKRALTRYSMGLPLID